MEIAFFDGFVKVLPMLDFYDHYPILICLRGNARRVAKPCFIFGSALLVENTYNHMIETTWKNNMTLFQNLYNIREGAHKWKWSTFRQVSRKKKEIMKLLEGTQQCIQARRHVGGLRRIKQKFNRKCMSFSKKKSWCGFIYQWPNGSMMTIITPNTITLRHCIIEEIIKSWWSRLMKGSGY